MSAVTKQPLPFGRLEREKHIQMLFRAFHRQHRASCDPQDSPGTQPHGGTPTWEPEEQPAGLAPGNKAENGRVRSPGQLSRPEVRERWPEDGLGLDSVEMLETISRLNVTARPELQGPQCVPRRTYSVAAGGSREQLFVVVEESSCLCLQCCGPARSCSLQGFDDRGHQVFHFQRPLRVDACCLGCCLMEMRVYTPENQLLGTVRQRWSMFTPLLEVCDPEGRSNVRIQGSCCPCRCLSDQEFQVISMIGEKIGTIWKKWPGFNDECNMDHEYFGLEVPLNMESHTKLLLLAAAFLLSHMFFEMS
ncbi:phospholipid scramblase family member 5 [Lampris incognitus]|uniref:phospholipid scramblase family member 5 n=1 Tax=Lampris incognitus TaxID=2546036 RepID=UPI0024B50D83|nr:phospholipid scramblase family member 5 [Lampris incognitus]